jgi:lysozyme family protein
MDAFRTALEFTLKWEGGYTDHPSDPGNWTGGSVGSGELKGTKYGISGASYPSLDIKNLTVEEAGKIYREKYWDAINGDLMPFPASMAVFDFAVNSGVGRATRLWEEVKGDLHAFQAGRLDFLASLQDFNTFGRGWVRRVNDLNKELKKNEPSMDIELIQFFIDDEQHNFYPLRVSVGVTQNNRTKIMARLSS